LTLQAVDVRASSKLATGEHVYAIGSPEGLELTFSEGVISALRDTEGVRIDSDKCAYLAWL
jgi:S1-C subfamily serine protease